jgi:hypothetical protein
MKSKLVTLFESTEFSMSTFEMQIQKGILQICKGLAFLHNSAKLIHSNLCPESVIINGAVSGFGICVESTFIKLFIIISGRLENIWAGVDYSFTNGRCSNSMGVPYFRW